MRYLESKISIEKTKLINMNKRTPPATNPIAQHRTKKHQSAHNKKIIMFLYIKETLLFQYVVTVNKNKMKKLICNCACTKLIKLVY